MMTNKNVTRKCLTLTNVRNKSDKVKYIYNHRLRVRQWFLVKHNRFSFLFLAACVRSRGFLFPADIAEIADIFSPHTDFTDTTDNIYRGLRIMP